MLDAVSNAIIRSFTANDESRACAGGPSGTVFPRIMNFRRIPNNIRIFKNDEYQYEYYLEFEKPFEYYSWEIFE